MPIRALIFDLDGTVVDTESPIFDAWEKVYRDHGQVLPRDIWTTRLGTDGRGFDPMQHLEELVARPLDQEKLKRDRIEHRDAMLADLPPREGVAELVRAASDAGLALAVASSSPEYWVDGNLSRLGLRPYFQVLRCREHVARTKPDPALFEVAASALGVDPTEAIAIEDSPNGVTSAVAAGTFCVAVPGPMTAGLAFDHAHRCLSTLGGMTLDALILMAEQSRPWRRA